MVTITKTLAVGSPGDSVSLGSDCYYIELYNEGANRAFINLAGTATEDDFAVDTGETLKVYTFVNTVYAIAASGSATLQIIATK